MCSDQDSNTVVQSSADTNLVSKETLVMQTRDLAKRGSEVLTSYDSLQSTFEAWEIPGCGRTLAEVAPIIREFSNIERSYDELEKEVNKCLDKWKQYLQALDSGEVSKLSAKEIPLIIATRAMLVQLSETRKSTWTKAKPIITLADLALDEVLSHFNDNEQHPINWASARVD